MSRTGDALRGALVMLFSTDPALADMIQAISQRRDFTWYRSRCVTESPLDGGLTERLRHAHVVVVHAQPCAAREMCAQVRKQTLVPLVVMADAYDAADAVLAFEVGADDYIAKPWDEREVEARLNAAARWWAGGGPVPRAVLRLPGLVVDVGRHEVLVDDEPVELTPTEFELLALLCESPGRVVTRSELVEWVWAGRELQLRSIDAHIYRLRRKLGRPGSRRFIHAVPNFGYRLSG